MRSSIKVSLTGLLIAGALACSADAMGAATGNSNGPDAFIGIVGGNPGGSVGGIPYNRGIYPGGGDQANCERRNGVGDQPVVELHSRLAVQQRSP